MTITTGTGRALAPLRPYARRLLTAWFVTVPVRLGRLLEESSLPRLRVVRAVWRSNHVADSADGPHWRPLSTGTNNPVKAARDYVARRLRHVVRTDREHVDDVVLAASELVTNAIRHTRGDGPYWIGVAAHSRWTHLYVSDTDIAVPKPTPTDGLALSGRGVPIVEELGLLWFVVGVYGKTAHVVIPRTGERLTDKEREALLRLKIV
ncbi:ATP-binding protein [Actinoallomurus acaciae]|uniref:ATP-binding protein n=1 Tax=Actinoallomurus acaciae TaxID=502577 RepID=A0ABV5Y7F7_9ACTN